MKKYHLNRYLPDVEKVHLAQWDLPKGIHLELLYLPECNKPLAADLDGYYLEGSQEYDDEITETYISRHFTIALTKELAVDLQPLGADRLAVFLDAGAEKNVKKALEELRVYDANERFLLVIQRASERRKKKNEDSSI